MVVIGVERPQLTRMPRRQGLLGRERTWRDGETSAKSHMDLHLHHGLHVFVPNLHALRTRHVRVANLQEIQEALVIGGDNEVVDPRVVLP